jgi:hypothetical protein
MSSDQNNNSGCLFPFGDDFLPILMFFFHLNQADSIETQQDEDEEDEDADDDEE